MSCEIPYTRSIVEYIYFTHLRPLIFKSGLRNSVSGFSIFARQATKCYPVLVVHRCRRILRPRESTTELPYLPRTVRYDDVARCRPSPLSLSAVRRPLDAPNSGPGRSSHHLSAAPGLSAAAFDATCPALCVRENNGEWGECADVASPVNVPPTGRGSDDRNEGLPAKVGRPRDCEMISLRLLQLVAIQSKKPWNTYGSSR